MSAEQPDSAASAACHGHRVGCAPSSQRPAGRWSPHPRYAGVRETLPKKATPLSVATNRPANTRCRIRGADDRRIDVSGERAGDEKDEDTRPLSQRAGGGQAGCTAFEGDPDVSTLPSNCGGLRTVWSLRQRVVGDAGVGVRLAHDDAVRQMERERGQHARGRKIRHRRRGRRTDIAAHHRAQAGRPRDARIT